MQATNPAFITIGLLIFLIIFMAISWVINFILKRKTVNGAMLFLFGAGILFFLNLIPAARSEYAPEAIGGLMGAYFIPVLLGLIFMRRFNKKKSTHSIVQENENS